MTVRRHKGERTRLTIDGNWVHEPHRSIPGQCHCFCGACQNYETNRCICPDCIGCADR